MTRDDDLVEHLRHLSRSTPPSTVDRDEVLRRGRRRRGTRAGGVGVAVVAAVVASGVGVHALVTPAPQRLPLADVETAAPAPTPDPDAVVFDEGTGTVAEPLDAYEWSSQELVVPLSAESHYMRRCLSAIGSVDPPAGPDSDPVPLIPQDGYNTFGLWSPSQADGARYGSGLIETGHMMFRQDPGIDADEAEAVRLRCSAEAVDADLAFDIAEVDALVPRPDGVTWAGDTEDGRAIIEQWAECVRAAGVPVTQQASLVPDGADTADPAERRRMAAVDLGCKARLGTVEAFAEVVAREQNAYIERARQFLEVKKEVQDRVLEASFSYLVQQGVPVPAMQ